MFTTIIVQPIFNLLVLIYALLPGHNFGLSIILFTIVVRLLMWPLLKKQLHQTKMMRKLQPEIKRIKAAAKGDRKKESAMTMELYKERGINPFGSIGIIFLQIPILLGLYSGLHRVVVNPHELVTFSYPALQHLSWLKELTANIHLFDKTLFGVVDLTRPALGTAGVYWPAMLIVIGSAVIQYFQSKQLMPSDKESRSLRAILKDAGGGKQADQGEVNAAIGRSTRFFIPAMIFLFTVNLASGLSLYWLVGGLVAFIQQSYILRQDVEEMDGPATKKPAGKTAAQERADKALEAEVIAAPAKKQTVAKAKSTSKSKKRRKR
jgi:YidC/Oxa1 family membrane protein insertase